MCNTCILPTKNKLGPFKSFFFEFVLLPTGKYCLKNASDFHHDSKLLSVSFRFETIFCSYFTFNVNKFLFVRLTFCGGLKRRGIKESQRRENGEMVPETFFDIQWKFYNHYSAIHYIPS
jgi:hypothetical protein